MGVGERPETKLIRSVGENDSHSVGVGDVYLVRGREPASEKKKSA